MVNYVYFILFGECKLIEHMIIEEIKSKRGIQYKKYIPHVIDSITREKFKKAEKKSEALKEHGKSFSKVRKVNFKFFSSIFLYLKK